ncbi:FAD-NAD(P)-binding protein [Paracoccus aestuarii]|uniref:FAD-NAD(P)-binding protein n=1 Tax=Paracoccus aestuarii TaxID=453842 RepID=A0A419A0Y5_9RHOB|nr:FAD/NAD(P)-binding protein [Paracoccus aestuarii]RJL06612.1 FAD-NAD(P)-binding protein [Paracoccus aestuarii]WCR00869.1 FAD/NAD(P)-binding protein [Paracoccus aestuarii]
MTRRTIAIVGSGPTGIYTLRHLLDTATPLEVTLFERGPRAGIGQPYSPDSVSAPMLANIASIEIPPVLDPYLDWLRDQPDAVLAEFGLERDALHDRLFTPRLLLGRYYRDQLLAMTRRARAAGHRITIREGTEVTDIRADDRGLWLSDSAGGPARPFDRVILATGHQFPDADEATRSYFPSPWSGLIQARIPAARVGIMGTSLSAIDAAMAVVTQHGRFRRDGDDLAFDLDPGSADLRIVLMSRSGILPEADFYCPIPYEPLSIATAPALAACLQGPAPLDAAFDLVRAEIMQADPAFALRIGLGGLDADSFADAYFAARQAADPFRWARRNLAEVERNKADRVTVAWRYALLRLHEAVEEIVPDLPDADRDRFDAGLKKVFVDNYAAVPSESIRRLLALRDAGILSLQTLGTDYDLTREGAQTVIDHHDRTERFAVFIDARGQKALSSANLPFPALRAALAAAGQDIPEVAEDYGLMDAGAFTGRLCLAALPYLMHDRPFVQGITACDDIARAIAAGMATRRRRRLTLVG